MNAWKVERLDKAEKEYLAWRELCTYSRKERSSNPTEEHPVCANFKDRRLYLRNVSIAVQEVPDLIRWLQKCMEGADYMEY